MPSDLKQVVLVTEELEAVSTGPGCVEVDTGNDNCISSEMKVENTVSSLPEKKRKLPDEFENDLSSDEANKYDHTYCIRSPRRLRRKVDDLIDQVENLKKRLDTSQKKTRRLKKKLSSLTTVVSELKKENLVSNDCASILERTFSGVTRDLMKRLVTQKKKKNPGAYPKELRAFAMTLKFYSAKAYKYVRKSFDLGLPHPSVVSSWYNVMDAEPGFTKEVLTALQAKVLAGKREGQEVVCALMLDEMSIHEMSIRKHGFVDCGTKVDDDSLPEATDALVFMSLCEF